MNTNARTAPSVSGSPKVNRRQLRTLEVHLGAFQLAVLLGLVTGSMACAFYLGFFSGQRVGYENALVGSASTLARFALNTKELNASEAGPTDDSIENLPLPAKEEGKRTGARAAREQKDQGALSLLNEVSAAPKTPKSEQPVAVVSDGGAVDVAPARAANLVKSESPVVAAETGPEDDVIRVYGNERQAKRTTIADLKSSADSASAKAKAVKAMETVASEQRTKVQAVLPQKPQVLASLQPEAKLAKQQAQQNRKIENVPVKSILAAGWYAQVAAPRKMADAESLANRLRKNGFPVSIESASVKGESYYRVIVGPEDNKKQAQVLVEQLRSERSVQGEPFIRSIR